MSALTFIVAVFGTNFLTNLYKKMETRFGDTKIHAMAGAISILAAIIISAFGHNHVFLTMVQRAGEIFAAALATYEVIWKQLGKVVSLPSTDLQA